MPKLLENKDGSAVVVLDNPVQYQGDEHHRVSLPALCAKHLRFVTWAIDVAAPSHADAVAFAAKLVQPAGIFDELSVIDGLAVEAAAQVLLGKAVQQTGATASPSSGTTSGGPAAT